MFPADLADDRRQNPKQQNSISLKQPVFLCVMEVCHNSILGFTNLQFISMLFSQAKNKPYLPWKQGGKYGFSIIIVSNYNILEGEF